MFFYEPMLPEDIFTMDLANLDITSENFTLDYYLNNLRDHPLNFIAVRFGYFHGNDKNFSSLLETNSPIAGYIFGRAELCEVQRISQREKIQSEPSLHISAISVSPACRRLKIGVNLLKIFEQNASNLKANIIKLFVRESNKGAQEFYKGQKYRKFRVIRGYYYSPAEGALDMRKFLDGGNDYVKEAVDIHSYQMI